MLLEATEYRHMQQSFEKHGLFLESLWYDSKNPDRPLWPRGFIAGPIANRDKYKVTPSLAVKIDSFGDALMFLTGFMYAKILIGQENKE